MPQRIFWHTVFAQFLCQEAQIPKQARAHAEARVDRAKLKQLLRSSWDPEVVLRVEVQEATKLRS